jgi:predicted acetyltransferase
MPARPGPRMIIKCPGTAPAVVARIYRKADAVPTPWWYPSTMVQLVAPTALVHASFLAAMAEFRDEGRGTATDSTEVGREIRTFGASWTSSEGFAAYLRWLADQAREDSPRPEGYVPATNLWLTAGHEYLGRIAIRHRLTDRLRQAGGHIGFDVRPSVRCRGHATRMLEDALTVARDLGIATALLTCDIDNAASRKVIERNGGTLQDRHQDKWRYWVPTAPEPAGR